MSGPQPWRHLARPTGGRDAPTARQPFATAVGRQRGWSTRELARLAGTTVNTIRHYHRVGLLEEPVRRPNGYKQYGEQHLLRLLGVRRLAELGVPLARISEIDARPEATTEVLRDADRDLASSIDRLERARGDIAAILDAAAAVTGTDPTSRPTLGGALLDLRSHADVLAHAGLLAWASDTDAPAARELAGSARDVA